MMKSDSMGEEGVEWFSTEVRLNAAPILSAAQRNFWCKPKGKTSADHDPRGWPSFVASHIEPFLKGGKEVGEGPVRSVCIGTQNVDDCVSEL